MPLEKFSKPKPTKTALFQPTPFLLIDWFVFDLALVEKMSNWADGFGAKGSPIFSPFPTRPRGIGPLRPLSAPGWSLGRPLKQTTFCPLDGSMVGGGAQRQRCKTDVELVRLTVPWKRLTLSCTVSPPATVPRALLRAFCALSAWARVGNSARVICRLHGNF